MYAGDIVYGEVPLVKRSVAEKALASGHNYGESK
jgi:hypothetical protein